MARPVQVIDGVANSQSALVESLDGLTDEVARQPSLLPGWSVGHVLTHLARNADSVVRRLQGAGRGEVLDQYSGGLASRAADIESGSNRSADALVADVAHTGAQVITVCATLDEAAWEAPSRTVSGKTEPSRDAIFSRWREVEVHRCDLGLGYTPAEWPPLLVAMWLPGELADLDQRTDPATLLAWIVGRGTAPALRPW